jgi:hypothetical protein
MSRLFGVMVICLLNTARVNAQMGGFPNYALYSPPIYTSEVPVKGSPLLFEMSWAHAKVVTADNKVIQNDSLFYNYDKLSHKLLITEDYRKIYEVDKREFKSVTFYWHDSVYIFEHVYEINKKDFFQELIRDDNKYSLYKFIRTAIRPVNWHGNGLASEGRTYDQYTDNPVYYIVFPNREYRVLYVISKNSIERAFILNMDGKKVNEWLSVKNYKITGEDFLWKLILYLNE